VKVFVFAKTTLCVAGFFALLASVFVEVCEKWATAYEAEISVVEIYVLWGFCRAVGRVVKIRQVATLDVDVL
jgi:hypothetical protein